MIVYACVSLEERVSLCVYIFVGVGAECMRMGVIGGESELVCVFENELLCWCTCRSKLVCTCVFV